MGIRVSCWDGGVVWEESGDGGGVEGEERGIVTGNRVGVGHRGAIGHWACGRGGPAISGGAYADGRWGRGQLRNG